jgi:hypothetical protein
MSLPFYETLFLPNTALRIAISAVIVTMLLMRPTSMLPEKLTLPLATAYVIIATAKSVNVSARKVIKNSWVFDFDWLPLPWSLMQYRGFDVYLSGKTP